MKRLFYLAAISVITFSCSKEPSSPAAFRGFRKPDCGNTVGEGVWEHFNDSETNVLITQSFDNPEVLDSTYVSNISVTAHDLSGKVRFYQKKPVTLVLAVQYNAALLVYGGTVDTSGIDVFKELPINSVGPTSPATQGCYRMYYLFTTRNGNKFRIVDKGHFDISVP